MLARLPRRLHRSVRAARKVAAEQDARAYLAGGVVRDLLLQRPVKDLDFVVEADAARFVRRLADLLGGQVRSHGRFGTATVLLPDGTRLDVAATRRETYERPGALPTVTLGASIEEDLRRRDFTVNAMAIEITYRARIIDPFGGRSDLSRGVIRMLHEDSALDDPTRAFRAVRYAHRLGFRIARPSRKAIRRAIQAKAFDAVSGDRLRRELASVLTEENRGAAVRRMHRLGLDAAIEPALVVPSAARRVRTAEELARHHGARTGWLCGFLAWMAPAGTGELHRVTSRLAISGRERGRIEAWPRTLRRLAPGLAKRPPSEVSLRMRGLSEDEIVAAAAALPPADRRALLRHAGRRVSLAIRGADLLQAGIPAGEAIGAALARTLAAREDGRITRREELSFAVRAAAEGARE